MGHTGENGVGVNKGRCGAGCWSVARRGGVGRCRLDGLSSVAAGVATSGRIYVLHHLNSGLVGLDSGRRGGVWGGGRSGSHGDRSEGCKVLKGIIGKAAISIFFVAIWAIAFKARSSMVISHDGGQRTEKIAGSELSDEEEGAQQKRDLRYADSIKRDKRRGGHRDAYSSHHTLFLSIYKAGMGCHPCCKSMFPYIVPILLIGVFTFTLNQGRLAYQAMH
jgi:hypothetical protein